MSLEWPYIYMIDPEKYSKSLMIWKQNGKGGSCSVLKRTDLLSWGV